MGQELYFWTQGRLKWIMGMQMKNHIKNRISIFLVVLGMVTILPIHVFAVEKPYASLDDMIRYSFRPENSVFTNPERGWFQIKNTTDSFHINSFKDNDTTMLLLEADLGAFKTSPISTAKLNEIQLNFDMARQGGLSVIFRAAYDFNGVQKCEPRDLNIILNHINQLKSIFYKNEDILYTVQAGFLGSYGEWHSSYYGPEIPLDVRQKVINALLAAVPPSITIQVRRPMFIREMFANKPGGNTLTETAVQNVSDLSRISIHNDALLSTHNDYGTYVESGYNRNAELNWTNNHAKYTPYVGETNYLSNLSDPQNTIYEFSLLHVQSLNNAYHPSVINKWKSTTYNGINTYDYIANQMGYRFVLSSVSFNTVVKKGGALHVSLSIQNDGFGNLIKKKDLEIILSDGKKNLHAKVNDDARKWYRENGKMVKDYYFSVPSYLESGTWNIYLSLSSPYNSLKGRADYSIRLANAGVWNASTGFNFLGSVQIDKPTSNNVGAFAQISRKDAERLISSTSISLPGTQGPGTTTDAKVPDTTPSISSMKISSNQTDLFIEVIGKNIPAKNQFYINADSSAATGYKTIWKEGGFDYLMENNSLYAYNGKNGSWNWKKVQSVTVFNSGSRIYAILPLAAIKIHKSASLDIGFLGNDNLALTYPSAKNSKAMRHKVVINGIPPSTVTTKPTPKPTPSKKKVSSISVSNNAKNITFKISGTNLTGKAQLFIDVNNNASKGLKYKWKSSGFEYLIEKDILYRYAGKKNKWKWKVLSSVKVKKTSKKIVITVPIKSLGIRKGKTIAFGFILNDSQITVYPKRNKKPVKYKIK